MEILPFDLTCVTNYTKDFASIFILQESKESKYFGQPGCYSATEFFRDQAAVRYLVREQKDDIFLIGYAELKRYPPIAALAPDCWPYWLKHHYCLSPELQLTRANTLFFNRFMYIDKFGEKMILRVVTECFLRDFKTRYIVVLQMPEEKEYFKKIPEYEIVQNISTVLYPRNFSVQQCKNVQRIYVIHRESIVDKLRYRKALPEDNDDIVEVIDMERPDLREVLGDFYIAEELLKEQDGQCDHKVFIIAEMNHTTVGFIWLNDNVDVRALVENYECEGFGNLIKFNRKMDYCDKRITVKGMEKKPNFKLFTEEVIESLYRTSFIKRKASVAKAVSCNRPCCLVSDAYRPQCRRSNVKNVRDSTVISTKNEYFSLREGFLRKMQVINEFLLSSDHYHIAFKKKICIHCNVQEGELCPSDSAISLDEHSNVFAIQLLGLHETMDKRYVFRFISTAFTAYPQRDYCIIAIPYRAEITPSLKIIFRHFISMVPRPKAKLEDSLFIIHRSTVFGDICLHEVRSDDVPQIERILLQSHILLNKRASSYTNISHSTAASLVPPEFLLEADLVRKVLTEVFENPFSEYKFMTIRCGNSMRSVDENIVVGFVIVRPFNEVHKLTTRFEVPQSEYISEMERGEVLLLRLHPNYYWESDAIFRQLACATGFWEFFYISSTTITQTTLTNDLAYNMQPLEPLPIVQLHNLKCSKNETESDANQPPPLINRLDLTKHTYAVFYNNVYPSQPFSNPEAIVIVGFNYVARALLRLLLFNFKYAEDTKCFCCLPRLRVMVISRPGVVEADYDNHFACSYCRNQADCWINFQNVNSFISDTTKRMDLRKWVNFINSKIKRINTGRKTVLLESGCELSYGKLILSPARRYGVPSMVRHEPVPPNYAQINNRFDKIKLYHKLMAINKDTNKNNDIKIIVYGGHLSAFECINFLLTHEVKAKFITLVVPFNPKERDLHLIYNICHSDPNIEVILQEMVEDLGVKVIERATLKRWKRYYIDDNLSHAIFLRHPDEEEFTLPCDLFISYDTHRVNIDFYNMLKRSGIETKDKGILVNDNFQTSDEHIYAIGSCIKLNKTPNHQYRNVAYREIAEKMIIALNLNLQKDVQMDEKYSMPVFFQAQLPMGYYMAKVVLPKRYLANHLSNEYGSSMVTYDDGNFSRVKINEHRVVEEIVCVTKQYREFDHLQHFVGLHEALLNDLHSRWYLGEIQSFIDFFEEPWTELIMHPNFHLLRFRIQQIAGETARDIMTTHGEMERRSRKVLMKRYMNESHLTGETEKAFLNFLRQHRTNFVHQFVLPEDYITANIYSP